MASRSADTQVPFHLGHTRTPHDLTWHAIRFRVLRLVLLVYIIYSELITKVFDNVEVHLRELASIRPCPADHADMNL